MYTRKTEENLDCGLYLTSKVLGGKWKCCILDAINKNITRPSDITRYINEASPRVIEMQLAELLAYCVIEKYAESGNSYPKKTEYRLTKLGASLLPVLEHMDKWGQEHSLEIRERMDELASA